MTVTTIADAARPGPSANPERTPTWRDSLTTAARRMAAITAAGALLGLLVVGVLGRLAMFVLAQLTPIAEGMTSDDGFVIGQFTLSGSLHLLASGAQFGVLGAVFYVVLRPLMIGPPWFRVLSIGLGPAVVVGELIVDVDGVDFTLDPAWLAIALFVLLPGLYCALLSVVAEEWLQPDRFFARAPLPLALAPLLFFGPLAPLLVVLAFGWVAVEAVRRRFGGVVPGSTLIAWAARAALAALFCLSLVRLVDETLILT